VKLNSIDIVKIHKYKPEFLRLYIEGPITEEELNFMSAGLSRIINRIALTTSNRQLIQAIKLQFPNVISETADTIIVERNKQWVEMDITTVCNLACNNCSRFSQYKSMWTTLSQLDIDMFIAENMHLGKALTVILLGGEPTLYKGIDSLIVRLNSIFHVMLSTNGITAYVPPVPIAIENSSKSKGVMPMFSSTMLAPIDDDDYANDDYSLGCHQAYVCGAGYTSDGYYPCSIASAIDRATREPGGPRENSYPLGCTSIEQAYKYKGSIFNELCCYCGTYKMKNFAHFEVKHQLTDTQPLSKIWKFMEDKK